MGFSLKGLIFGDDSPAVESKFSENIENVTDLLSKTTQNVDMESEANSSASNKLKVSGVTASGKGSKVNVSVEQSASAQAIAKLDTLITSIINSDADAETKLDALLNVNNASTNDGAILTDAGIKDNTEINIKNSTKLQAIQELNMNLRAIASAVAANELEISNIKASGEDSEINIQILQSVESRSEDIIDLVNEATQGLSSKEVNDIVDQIEKDNDAQAKGLLKGVADDVADVANNAINSAKWVMYAIPIIIIVIIISIACVFIFKNRSYEGGYKYFDYIYDHEL